jgi:eukaryotic-like serine/threonine-protein kinase
MKANRAEADPGTEQSREQSDRLLVVLEQYLSQRENGACPQPEDLIAQYPEFADALPEYLRELDQLHEAATLASTIWESGEAAGHMDPERGRVGDFKIVREVGRGGMGVVYEAEQIFLGRRVALKVLPFAATLDAKQLQRFKNEAHAAAQLHHTHIVPIYAVGSERGVHYYAMQFIEGQSLAEVIADLRNSGPRGPEGTAIDSRSGPQPPGGEAHESTPTPPIRKSAAWPTERSTKSTAYFRAVTQLGIEAAEALEHAHLLGVVHRDIKPGNLLVDASGHLWIADFGLARFHTERGLTLSGDVVGTLRYMSPEQALAKRALVDHRSDIYSLGITLYEALTLEPAYPSSDREELLQLIAANEPVPPRRLKPPIPVELETIVLKAIAREPERRYPTAQEMADDLRRFLENRPILAVRPTLWERAAKWSQRHKAFLAAAAACVGLIVAVALLVSTILIWREKEQAQAALVEARIQSELAQANAREAQTQKQRAEANFDGALDVTMQLLVGLEEPRWNNLSRIQELRRDFNDRGIRFFERFLHEDSPDPALRFETARAYLWMSSVYSASQEIAKAKECMGKAISLLENLIAGSPAETAYRRQLTRTLYLMGIFCNSYGQLSEAEDAFRKLIQVLRDNLTRDAGGEDANALAWTLVDCPVATLRKPAEAITLAKRALTLSPEEGRFWNTLGVAYYRGEEFKSAIHTLEESMKRRSGGDPYDWFFIAMAYKRLGDDRLARQWFDKSQKWLESRSPTGDTFRYRVEAEMVLGLKGEKKTGN